MSGYGTKKRGGDVALQMTFPDVASAFVAETEPEPYGYVGRAMIGKAPLPVADDLQQRYHREKSHYANMSAMDGVHNEERSDWLLRHNTYGYTQPRPKLSQRVFANPSLGNQADIYSARHDVGGLSGGWHRGPLGELVPDAGDEYPKWQWWENFTNWLDGVAPWVSKYGWDMLATAGSPGGHGPGGHYKPDVGIIKDMGKKKADELAKILEQKRKEEAEQLRKWQENQDAIRKGRDDYARQIKEMTDDGDDYFGPRRGRGDLHGGVLRTAEGQRYGRNLLKDRIRQLDAINSAMPGSADGPLGATKWSRTPELPDEGYTDASRIDLTAKLEEINGTYAYNRTLANLATPIKPEVARLISEAQRLLFRLAPSFTIVDFNAVLRVIESTYGLARVTQQRRIQALGQGNLYETRMLAGIITMLKYTRGMIKYVNYSYKDKVARSQALVRTLTDQVIGRGGADAKEYNINPAYIKPLPTPPPPPPPSGTDFSKGETQGWRVMTQPKPPRDAPELAPEEPEEEEDMKMEKADKPLANRPVLKFAQRERGAKFTEDQRVRFGDRQGAYYGEEIGDRVPEAPVPVPVTPDGEYVHPGSGYVRKTFPKFTVQKKPSNSLKPRRMAPIPKLPMFQETASGIFNEPRIGLPKVTSIPAQVPFTFTGGRKGLPKTVEGFMDLAKKLNGAGHSIRVNPTSKLSSIRQNFIRNLLL